ncbi:MAG: pyridoxine 5'-phosphate synthase [Flavobacteriaceae bacterium]|nr:pyridoxine 5'-phosphate synthase [Flavobacteriaceae bacterium]MDG1328330.1 pyridoxine 5'-phosphate synthase [Flavobacteriaceae bacterium]MDG2447498.1 pyridoxine 5'-phosphate synthase [Flavobacteriaceae bacterium]|tara:strand:- start:322 stop:1035 length:714 start_codon:yes stop_codon:yes gene_type:complete
MTKLSVNINKIATLRNSRGGQTPSVLQAAIDVQKFGAEGVTVHPRPDERHIRYQDAYEIQPIITTEYNIEGNPIESFLKMVFNIKPTQVTLVPDAIDALTSNAGWNTVKHRSYLTEIISEFKSHGIRTSIFVDPKMEMIEGAAATGTDRIELYTEDFAAQYNLGNKKAVEPYTQCALKATELGLGINAGHDLSLENIRFFKDNIPNLLEVSIGHALICESIYLGLENVIGQYLKKLK